MLSPPILSVFLHCSPLPLSLSCPPPMTYPLPPITGDLFVLCRNASGILWRSGVFVPGNEVSGFPLHLLCPPHYLFLSKYPCRPSGTAQMGPFRRGERHRLRYTAALALRFSRPLGLLLVFEWLLCMWMHGGGLRVRVSK